MFKIDNEMACGYAQLNVSHLDQMKEYYAEKIGLAILKEDELQVDLGIKETGTVLIVLKKVATQETGSLKAGLFHTAFLLPTRRDLGNCVFSLLNKDVPIGGASDHGYSEAIYLQDPEGNGIEIYRDKPRDEWTINEDGTIPGVTEEMDAEGVLQSRDEEPTGRLPEGTVIGHMHLSVSDLDETEAFYRETLGLSLKYTYGTQARFLAGGSYHHHIGINTWAGKGLPIREREDLGLSEFSINLSSKTALKKLTDQLSSRGYDIDAEADSLTLTDPNGIQVIVRYLDK
ncbi:MAG: VOC family protein [Alkalibacterium sp.]|nr:VOC family protein [Alkalibacterium sp.]